MSKDMVSSVRYGDLMIEWDSSGAMRITRQSDMTAVLLSLSEWNFLLKVADLRGWPILPPDVVENTVRQVLDRLIQAAPQ